MPRPEPVPAKQSQPASPARNVPKSPVDKFREGPVHVSIWENDSVNGVFRSASFEIRFRKGNEWKSGSSYGMAELAYLELAAKQARTRIEQWTRCDRNRPAPART